VHLDCRFAIATWQNSWHRLEHYKWRILLLDQILAGDWWFETVIETLFMFELAHSSASIVECHPSAKGI